MTEILNINTIARAEARLRTRIRFISPINVLDLGGIIHLIFLLGILTAVLLSETLPVGGFQTVKYFGAECNDGNLTLSSFWGTEDHGAFPSPFPYGTNID